jgi:putative ABC transport system ATP-binding protein
MIALQGVIKTYNAGRPNQVEAIRGIDLTISRQTLTVLAGPSGSGKTTLASLIGCLARPTSGRILVDGEVVSGLPERFLTEARRRLFGFVFQRFNLVRGTTALENVMLPAYPTGIPHGALTRRADELLDSLGMKDRSRFAVEHLSGGEVQRVAIARSLINDPQIIIADEPTANLDGERVAQFLAIAADLKRRGKTLIVNSHDPRITTAPAVDVLVTLADGRLASGRGESGSC